MVLDGRGSTGDEPRLTRYRDVDCPVTSFRSDLKDHYLVRVATCRKPNIGKGVDTVRLSE
jgi:hypothetical protein